MLQASPQIADPNQLTVGQDIRLPVCQAQSPAQTDTGTSRRNKASDSSVLVSEDSAMAEIIAKIQLGGGGHGTAGPAGPVMFAGPPKQTQAQKHKQWLGELARDPGQAHMAWKKLGPEDRAAVLKQMEGK